MRGYLYLSDSNMNWKTENPFRAHQGTEYERIHMLIHPLWWLGSANSTADKWNSVIAANFEIEQDRLLRTEGAFGKRRILVLKTAEG